MAIVNRWAPWWLAVQVDTYMHLTQPMHVHSIRLLGLQLCSLGPISAMSVLSCGVGTYAS